MKERCWVRVDIPVVDVTVFVYFGDDGLSHYRKWLKSGGVEEPDFSDMDGNTYEFRCWVESLLDISTVSHELCHITDNLCDARCIDNGEFFAYTQCHLLREVMRKRNIVAHREKPCKKK